MIIEVRTLTPDPDGNGTGEVIENVLDISLANVVSGPLLLPVG